MFFSPYCSLILCSGCGVDQERIPGLKNNKKQKKREEKQQQKRTSPIFTTNKPQKDVNQIPVCLDSNGMCVKIWHYLNPVSEEVIVCKSVIFLLHLPALDWNSYNHHSDYFCYYYVLCVCRDRCYYKLQANLSTANYNRSMCVLPLIHWFV